MSRWVAEALENDPYRKQFREGDHLNWRGLVIKPLWPKNSIGGNFNDESLVLEVIFGSHRIMLMGDAGNKAEYVLVNENKLTAPYDVLVAGHHGSRGASSDAFLQFVKPVYSIVSTNAGNIRRYPAADTVTRLRKFSSKGLLMTYAESDIYLDWPTRGSITKCLNPMQ